MPAALHVIEPEPIASDAIATLEGVIALARNDEISSVCIAWVNRDGSISSDWSHTVSGPLLVAAVARAQHKILQAIIDDA